jgi:hypothetical protein
VIKVLVELDHWDWRDNLRPELRLNEDDNRIWFSTGRTGDNKAWLSRTIQKGNYCFSVFVEEYRGTSFFVRASLAIRDSRKRRAWRERPLKPEYRAGEAVWSIDRTGVFAEFPLEWDDYWANNFIKETLDFLRSPEIPKHFELHGDSPEEL